VKLWSAVRSIESRLPTHCRETRTKTHSPSEIEPKYHHYSHTEWCKSKDALIRGGYCHWRFVSGRIEELCCPWSTNTLRQFNALCFQQDATAPHLALAVRNFVNEEIISSVSWLLHHSVFYHCSANWAGCSGCSSGLVLGRWLVRNPFEIVLWLIYPWLLSLSPSICLGLPWNRPRPRVYEVLLTHHDRLIGRS
jgi:hypothetical protein